MADHPPLELGEDLCMGFGDSSGRESPSPCKDIPVEEIFSAVQQGDEIAQEIAARRIFPRVVAAIQHRFHGERGLDPEEAALSAFRTIQRRGWEFRRGEEFLEPTSWDELAGICVRFAYNKARTALKKRQRSRETGGTATASAAAAMKPMEPAASRQGDFDDPVVREEMLAQLRAAVQQLYEGLDEKECAILRGKMDGLTSRQVCDRLAKQNLYLTQSGIDKRWRRKILPQLQVLLDVSPLEINGDQLDVESDGGDG